MAFKDLVPHFRFTFFPKELAVFPAYATCYRVKRPRLPIYIYLYIYVHKRVKKQGCTKFCYNERDDVDESTLKPYSAVRSVPLPLWASREMKTCSRRARRKSDFIENRTSCRTSKVLTSLKRVFSAPLSPSVTLRPSSPNPAPFLFLFFPPLFPPPFFLPFSFPLVDALPTNVTISRADRSRSSTKWPFTFSP